MTEPEPSSSPRMTFGGWVVLASLVFLMVISIVYAAWVWGRMEGVMMSTAGWVYMGLGVFFSLLVGGGLMGLVFYSHRKNYDR